MFTIQYFCPRQAPYWQSLTEGLIWKTPRQFSTFESAVAECNSLLWKYHSARVLDQAGNPVYQV
jgi:hypothetical protein